MVAANTYTSIGSALPNNEGPQSASGAFHGSVQFSNTKGTFNGSTNLVGESQVDFASSISPINATQPNRSFKYRSKQVAMPSRPRVARKNTSRGRGTIVAHSTSLTGGPPGRKQAKIIPTHLAANREAKQAQLSQ